MSATLAEMLAIGRQIKGLSLRDVEKAIGLSNAFISQIETGKTEPSFRNAVALCEFYNIPVETLAKTVRNNKHKG